MKKLIGSAGILLAFAMMSSLANAQSVETHWTEARASAWYEKQPWLVGANYVPSDAINELEMFQPATFNPELNDRELGLAASAEMNTIRVFLQDQLWTSDPDCFIKRLNTFLGIAARHHIRPMFVLFDSCWDPNPRLGPQQPPIPGVHNSGWVQVLEKRSCWIGASNLNSERMCRGSVVLSAAGDDAAHRR